MIYLLKLYKLFKKNEFNYFVVGADIGASNTRIGFAGVKNEKITLLFTLNYHSDAKNSVIKILRHAIKYAEEKYKIKPAKISLAVAGPITNKGNYSEMTNIKWKIDRKKIQSALKIKIKPLINDLEAAGHAINNLKKSDVKLLSKGNTKENYPKSIIAAGTGLGKCTVYEDKIVPSEMGNVDFSPDNQFDLDLAEFVKQKRKISAPVQYEDLISGSGIEQIYLFLVKKGIHTSMTNEILKSAHKAELISENRKNDHLCSETFKHFVKYYARFAKNVAHNDLPFGGIFISGSIASKNHDAFNEKFLNEFYNSETHKNILKKISIKIILNTDINVKGACYAALK